MERNMFRVYRFSNSNITTVKLVMQENNKLKDLKIEKPLGNFDLEMFNE